MLSTLVANTNEFNSKFRGSYSTQHNHSSSNFGGYKSTNNKNKGRDMFSQNFNFGDYKFFGCSKSLYSNSTSGILGTGPPMQKVDVPPMHNYQICGKNNNLANTCRFKNAATSQVCQICGKNNHFANTCQFGINVVSQGCFICGNPHYDAIFCFQKNSSPTSALHVNNHSPSVPPLCHIVLLKMC